MNTTEDMNITVTFRHTEPTPALKSYAIEKVTHCLRKYVSGHADIQVILTIEKRDHIAEVIVHCKAYDAAGKIATADLYSSIDRVMDIVETQLRKQKDRYVTGKHQAAS